MRNLISVVARNSFFGAFGKLSVKVLSFAFTIVIIRWLGDEGYGQYTLIWSYVTIFAMLSDAGLGMYAIREIAKQKAGSGYIAGNIIALRLVLALLTIGLIMAATWLLGYPADFLRLVFLASLILILYALEDPLEAVLQARERFDLAAAVVIAGQLVFVAAGALFLQLGWDITGLILAGLLNVLAAMLLAWRLVSSSGEKLHWRLAPLRWPSYLRASFSFGLIKFWLSWSLKLDTIILAWFWSHQVVGWYAAAYAIITGLLLLSNSINAALYPSLSRQFLHRPGSIGPLSNLILKYLLVLSLPIAVGLSLTAEAWVGLLYGPDFAPAVVALAVLAWAIPLTFCSEYLRYLLLITDQERQAAWSLGLAVLLIALLNLALVPSYGILAAAGIVVVVEAGLVLLYLRQLRTQLVAPDWIDVLVKPGLAGLILLVSLKLVAEAPLVGQVVVGSLSYVAACGLLGVVKPAEYLPLYSRLRRYTPASVPVSRNRKADRPGPLVTVFIPAYNAGSFVAQAVNSVLAQSYPHYELIVIDDGSTDDTAAVLAPYRAEPKVRLYRNPDNIGMAPTWNMGLKLAQGQLVAKLDADDFYEPNYLQTVVDFWRKQPQAGLIFSGLNLIYPDGRREAEMFSLRSWVRNRESFLPTLLQLCMLRSPTICVRRDCYDHVGGFIEQMQIHADWEMWVRLAAHYPVGFIARRLANYRMAYGQNVTAQAALNGNSMADLQLWLELLAAGQLPYTLSQPEMQQFYWGIYEAEMHFAGMAAFYNSPAMQAAYTSFAEKILPKQPPAAELERMRQVYTDLHQGICAFRANQLPEAQRYFLQAIKTGPRYCRRLWIWNKLMLTYVGRTKWGIMYK